MLLDHLKSHLDHFAQDMYGRHWALCFDGCLFGIDLHGKH